jgi:hypothetical protein
VLMTKMMRAEAEKVRAARTASSRDR